MAAVGRDPVVGDVRLRPDAAGAADIGDGWVWMPADVRWPDDAPLPGVRSSTLTQGERDAIGLDTLPKTLAGALDLLDASATMRAALGDDMVDLYLAVRRAA